MVKDRRIALPFRKLTERQQQQARASFINAGPQDDCLYELAIDESVLCRRYVEPKQPQARAAW